jgi:peptide/nickel transport system substrate-binding protein
LLDAAGWKRGAGGTRSKNGQALTIDLALPAGQPTRATEAALVHDAWQAAGATVTIHPWSASQFFAPASAGGVLMNATFDVALVANGVGPVYANINGAYDCASITPRGFNLSRSCDPAVDALNGRYLHDFDARERRSIAAAMQRAIDAQTPVVPLYNRAFLSAYDARLRGYRPSSFTYWGDPLDLDL